MITKYVKDTINSFRVKNKPKIFCIGRNKTGTTSIKLAFERLGYVVGDQRSAELLIDDYTKRDFRSLVKYCHTAQVFQDFPFSYPETYKELDSAFPASKFILSIRDSPEQWYNSITKFHSKLFGRGHLPDPIDLKTAGYVYKGWIWKAMQCQYKEYVDDPYKRELLEQSYIDFNQEVQAYFSSRDNDLLILNLSQPDSYQKFCSFLGIHDSINSKFPWKNKTESIKIRL